MVFLPGGPESIRKGLLAYQIYDWQSLRYLSFDFKIQSGKRRGRRRTQTVALISDERKRYCCKESKAIFGVWIGEYLI